MAPSKIPIFDTSSSSVATKRSYSLDYLKECLQILEAIDASVLDSMAFRLAEIRDEGGRLFVLGIGGSAGNASHAVSDFRKNCAFEAYAPTDNICELTARTNDDGWETVFSEWLRVSRLSSKDAVLVFSVGGGSTQKNISPNLVKALELARQVGAKIFGIVGRDGGFTKQVADFCLIVPPFVSERVTVHTEGLCSVLWHLLVSHPQLQKNCTKWESIEPIGTLQ